MLRLRARTGVRGCASARQVPLVTCCLALLLPLSASAADKATKETFGSGGRTRTYYLLVPESAKKAGSPPLIVLLHGSGRDGKSLLDPWTPLAKKEGIVLVAPDAMTPQGWRVPEDGPEFLYDLVELIANQIDVDRQRVYIFGHSAGAGHGLVMALLESEYFAAVAVHAGMLPESSYPMIDRAARKTPIAMWIGTDDALFPLPVVRATRDALKAHGFHPQLTELAAHTHNYYIRAGAINQEVWKFLQPIALPNEPKYERYAYGR